MRVQASLEIILSIVMAFCMMAAAYPVYAHAHSISDSAASSVLGYASGSADYYSAMSNLCGCN